MKHDLSPISFQIDVSLWCLSTANQGDNTFGIVHLSIYVFLGMISYLIMEYSLFVFFSNQGMFAVSLAQRPIPLDLWNSPTLKDLHINRLVNFSWVVREIPCTCDLHNKSSVVQCETRLMIMTSASPDLWSVYVLLQSVPSIAGYWSYSENYWESLPIQSQSHKTHWNLKKGPL